MFLAIIVLTLVVLHRFRATVTPYVENFSIFTGAALLAKQRRPIVVSARLRFDQRLTRAKTVAERHPGNEGLQRGHCTASIRAKLQRTHVFNIGQFPAPSAPHLLGGSSCRFEDAVDRSHADIAGCCDVLLTHSLCIQCKYLSSLGLSGRGPTRVLSFGLRCSNAHLLTL